MAGIANFSWASSLADHAWTLLLTDTVFLDGYFAEMSARLSRAYALCTAELKALGIKYIAAYVSILQYPHV